MPQESTTPSNKWVPLPRKFYRREPALVAPELLNKLLIAPDGRCGRIVEVEAYGGPEDTAAHTFRGPTPRNAVMFGPPGHLYVYLSYGLHWCCNAVCQDEGVGAGVLIRALEPVARLQQMRSARGNARNDRQLCNGPGKLSQALGLGPQHAGADLVTGNKGVVICDDGISPPPLPRVTRRIGISKAIDLPWRWQVANERF
jgi:DNA-3-methyladenine glycosylase